MQTVMSQSASRYMGLHWSVPTLTTMAHLTGPWPLQEIGRVCEILVRIAKLYLRRFALLPEEKSCRDSPSNT